MAEKIYNAALIGCGRIGYTLGLDRKREFPASHTHALQGNSRISLIAACDCDAVTLSIWHEANKKTLVYRDSANLYARHKLDIVTVAVNEKSHVREALDAIISHPGLVILEKPVALNMEEALKIRESAERHNVPVLVNHQRRFGEDYRLARRYLSRIGELVSINARLCTSGCVYSKQSEQDGSYSLLHDGTHLVDAVLLFLEGAMASGTKTVQVPAFRKNDKGSGLLGRAMGGETLKDRTVNSMMNSPVVTGLVRNPEGQVLHLRADYCTERCPDVSLTFDGMTDYFAFDVDIVGTEGRICIGNGYLKFYHSDRSEMYSGFKSLKSDNGVKYPRKTQQFSNMVQNAVDFLDGKEMLRSTLQNGINALAVVEELKEKLKSLL